MQVIRTMRAKEQMFFLLKKVVCALNLYCYTACVLVALWAVKTAGGRKIVYFWCDVECVE